MSAQRLLRWAAHAILWRDKLIFYSLLNNNNNVESGAAPEKLDHAGEDTGNWFMSYMKFCTPEISQNSMPHDWYKSPHNRISSPSQGSVLLLLHQLLSLCTRVQPFPELGECKTFPQEWQITFRVWNRLPTGEHVNRERMLITKSNK